MIITNVEYQTWLRHNMKGNVIHLNGLSFTDFTRAGKRKCAFSYENEFCYQDQIVAKSQRHLLPRGLLPSGYDVVHSLVTALFLTHAPHPFFLIFPSIYIGKSACCRVVGTQIGDIYLRHHMPSG